MWAVPTEQGYYEPDVSELVRAKAYQQFQSDGLIRVQRGVGMFVREGAAAKLRESEREAFLREEWPAIRQRMERLGLDPCGARRARLTGTVTRLATWRSRNFTTDLADKLP